MKYLLQSSTINLLDTAINYRCQQAERTIGAALKTILLDDTKDENSIKREEIFVCSKSGYVPDDA